VVVVGVAEEEGAGVSERHVFVADVHLKRDETAKRDALIRVIDALAAPGTRLYLLGDTFDVWIGAGQLEAEPEMRPVIDAMERFTRSGGALAYFHGNRDFYMGRWLTRRMGAETVRDSKTISLDGRRTHLTHGEGLCTADQLHHFVRWMLQSPVLTAVFHLLPRELKYGASRAYRGISTRIRPRHQAPRHGINRAVLNRLIRRGIEVVICGHAHAPADRVLRHAGREARLIVLPPWTDRGWMLEYSDGAFALKAIDYA
jgi:UDP-2,3-diacylglucosamine hydrolase